MRRDPDLRTFRANGGKSIQYHGWGDPAISARSALGSLTTTVCARFLDEVSGCDADIRLPAARRSSIVCSWFRAWATAAAVWERTALENGASAQNGLRSPDVIQRHWTQVGGDRHVAPDKIIATRHCRGRAPVRLSPDRCARIRRLRTRTTGPAIRTMRRASRVSRRRFSRLRQSRRVTA